MGENSWYKEGLSFKCTGCGQCCTGFPGYVWITPEEMQAMAEALAIPLEEFTKKYTRKLGNRYSLKERPKTYDCVFLQGKKCTVYTTRPKQCRTFPWWPENIGTKEQWEETAKLCEGINHPEATTVSFEEIEEQLLIQIGKPK